jgi:sterol desaturase/sphingolipid hydroxylase (fatty acid hydroxylase superfamily)
VFEPLAAKTALIAAWFALLAAGERLLPSAKRPRRPRITKNLALWALNTLMNPLITVPISVAAVSLDPWNRPDIGLWPSLIVDIVILDLWTYLWHRANHRWPVLWRFHRVHHFDQFLDTASAVRFHPGEVLISALTRAPVVTACDINLTSLVIFDALALAAALFHHSNLRLPPRAEAALRWVVVTPSHHWVHHHAVRADTDSNYGLLLTLWDRLFGSVSPNRRTHDMPIGAEGETDQPLLRLLLCPFRRT